MDITLKSRTHGYYTFRVHVRYPPHNDGVCQYCGRTRIARIARVQCPVNAFALLQTVPPAIEQIQAVAVLSGQDTCQFVIGLTCLSKFFALFNGIDASFLRTIDPAVKRIERYATLFEKLQAFNDVQLTEDIWNLCRPVLVDLQSTRDIPHALQTQMRGLRNHVWFSVASPVAIRDIYDRVRALACRFIERRITLVVAKEHLHTYVKCRYILEVEAASQKLRSAEQRQLYTVIP